MPTITAEILIFIGGSIPIVVALWKLFAIRSELEVKILANAHKLELVMQKQESLDNQQLLMINGQRELLEHVRERTRGDNALLSARIGDIERYLTKTTDFEPRERDR